MARLNVAVIGVGVLGRHHTRFHSENPNAELVGIYDDNLEHARSVAAEFNTTAYESLDELTDKVDAFSVAVPTDLHYDVVSKLLLKDKHVLVEKPITATVAEGEKLVALANERNLALQVGHVERYNPVITYLEQKIDNPRFIEAHRLASYPPPRPGMLPRGTEVGVVFDLMIHDIDVILHLVKSEVDYVDASGIPVLSQTEDIANARITFKNGCVANVTASRVSLEVMRKIRVFQTDAYLSLDYGEKKGELVSIDGINISSEPVPIEDHNALEKEIDDFVHCVLESRETGGAPRPQVSGAHAQRALEIADEIATQITVKNKKHGVVARNG
jgi:predicted dehydrogenase